MEASDPTICFRLLSVDRVWFEIVTEQVRRSARAVGAFAEQADAVGSGCLDALAECVDVVRHPEVAAASHFLFRRGGWSTGQLPMSGRPGTRRQ
jgi:hypothetical protein